MNITSFLKSSVKKHPQKKAIIDADDDSFLTYKELYHAIQTYSSIFLKNGIYENKKVAICIKNSFEQIISFFSLLYIGAIPVLIDNRFCEREIIQCLQNSQTDVLIGEINKKNTTLLFNLLKKKCHKIFVFSDEKKNKTNKIVYIPKNILTVQNNSLINPNPNTGYIILFTYRGYGYPLPVLLSERAIMKNVLSNNFLTEINSSLCISLFLPSSHVFALTCNILSPISVAGTIVIIRSFQPRQILSFIEKYRINFIIVVPTLIKVLLYSLRKKSYDLSSLLRGIVGGDKFSNELFCEWKDLTGCVLLQGYGLTETCPVICNQWRNNKPDSIGKMMVGAFAKIMDEKGNELKDNKKGKLWIKTRSMMTGYLNQEKLNKKLLNDGWFDTGDIAWKDKHDFFYFDKKSKNIAKVGGSTVDILEVKKVINNHPDIDEVKIFTDSDKLWQEKLVCNIKTKKKLTKIDIIEYCKDYLASYKIPKDIIIEKIK
ncbi:MAG: acyl--CoA ligase [Spirochaetes bacterium]|nr:acyl--CoA ligase [Spirochaetota bacterium]